MPPKPGSRPRPRNEAQGNRTQDDGTTQLLKSGGLILAVGLASFLLLMTVLGGISVEGAHSNSGWLALIVAATCLPFGLMLAALGAAKWLRNRSLDRRP